MMRKKLQLVATLCLLAFSVNSYAQRYLAQIFTSVTVTPNVVYGNNISNSILTAGNNVPTDLKMDVYQPANDSNTARPLVIVLHTGSFMPTVINGQPTGSKSDSAVVEMCTRFAKRGYVAVAADYRLGWNPVSTNQDARTGTLLQAVYRSIQDAKNCVRFFKNDKATTNTYLIDTTKIAVGGLGSGGYIALAYASLNQLSEIQLGKFIDNSTTPPRPYVDQDTLGNFDGTNTAYRCTPNYATHSSKINMVFNIGGAVGDLSWIQAGEVPVVALQCVNDPNAPYKTGAVIVPTTGDFVVEASGSYDVIRVSDSLNNNSIFLHSIYNDVYTAKANIFNDGHEALYPFVTPAAAGAITCGSGSTYPQLPETEQGAPWDWWNESAYSATATAYGQSGPTVACNALTGNPDMSATKGRKYIDTIQGYLNPRIVCALGLPGCVPNPAGINEYSAASELSIFPNPSSTEINFSVQGSNTIKSVELYDVTGRMVKQVVGLNTQKYTIQRAGLATGLYISKIQLNKGSISKKIILE